MSRLTSTQNLALYDTCPIGAIIAFPSAAIPNGWLECNGQAVSRAGYSELFFLIGTAYGVGDGTSTFNLPDYRGVFLRGKDNGKGYDAGRAMGSYQTDELLAHTHAYDKVILGSSGVGGDGGSWRSGLSTGQATGSAGGAETRPKNVSVVFCIKAKNIIVTNLSTISTFAALTHTTHNGEAVSFGANGYKKLADGLIVQWGMTAITSNPQTITFPVAFSSGCYAVVSNWSNAGGGQYWSALTHTYTATNFQYGGYYTGYSLVWQAIGR